MATLTFDDEFNNLSLWNGSSGTWQPAYGWSPNGYADSTMSSWLVNPNAPGMPADADVYSVNNGALSMTIMNTPSDANPSLVGNKPYLSGQLTTKQSFSQEYGYFETRAQMPAGSGTTGAFWLLPQSGAWPPELDVEEIGGSNPNALDMTAHSNATGTPTANPHWNYSEPDMTAGYHVYAVDWTPTTITWYMDGNVQAQEATPSDFRQPMYILLDDLAGAPGSWDGSPSGSLNAAMNVDYVRVFDSNPYANGATNPDWNDTAGPSSAPPALNPPPPASGSGTSNPSGSSGSAGFTPSAPPSPDNTVVTVAGGGAITDASGNVWSIAGGQVAVNGTPDPTTANVIELAYEKGLVWQENSDSLWWSKANPGDTWSPGSGTATSPVPATSAPSSAVSPDTLTLALSEDAYQVDAQFIVKVDGAQLGGAQSVTAPNSAGQTQAFTFAGSWGAGPHSVEVDFLNDAYAGPGQDRNLYVDQLIYDGQAAMGQPTPLYTNGGVTIPVGQS